MVNNIVVLDKNLSMKTAVNYARKLHEQEKVKRVIDLLQERIKLTEENNEIIDSLTRANKVLQTQLIRFEKGKVAEFELKESLKQVLQSYKIQEWGERLEKLEQKLSE